MHEDGMWGVLTYIVPLVINLLEVSKSKATRISEAKSLLFQFIVYRIPTNWKAILCVVNQCFCMRMVSLFYFSLYTTSTCIQTHTKALHTWINCHSWSKHFSTSEILQTLSTMASSSNLKKRTKRAYVKNVEPIDNSEAWYLEKWFSENQESIDEYYREYSRKAIISPKFIRMQWLKEEKLNEVRDLLKFQRLDRFVKLSGNTYPDLVKVFLTNMWYDEETIYSQVKGVDCYSFDQPVYWVLK